jgi:phage shock protein PspC (stress-responsive transcriptional regulator)
MNEKKLMRSRTERVFLGVAGGLGAYFDIDPVLVRIFFVLIGLASLGQAALVYFLLALLMPEEPAAVAKGNAFDEDEIVIKEGA